MKSLLEARNVGFRFGDKPILERLNFNLEAGTCTALIGPNGIGKTTLLRVISGSLPATTGKVLLDGEPLHSFSAKQRAKRIALVPQQLDLPFDFTVQQVVEQGRTPHLGILRGLMREDHIAVDNALDLTDATGLRHRIFNELSGGEKQRVKIALALAQQPTLLLLDEPTQNLDIGRQVELLDLLEHLRAEGTTLLASIHDLHLVSGNFSTVLLLSPDRSLIIGDPVDVLTSNRLANAFECDPSRHPLLMGAL